MGTAPGTAPARGAPKQLLNSRMHSLPLTQPLPLSSLGIQTPFILSTQPSPLSCSKSGTPRRGRQCPLTTLSSLPP